MDIFEKLKILSTAAKYDVSCSSSGGYRKNTSNGLGNSETCGICHSFTTDGRCISLLKVLLTNYCVYNCKYCLNRSSNDVPRASFTPKEIADLTINFYKRNYIEGLFLSSAIVKNPNHTMDLMYQAIKILREEYHFNGYIHAKAIPGSDEEYINKLGKLVDRMSVNIELPSQESLKLLAPEKEKTNILKPISLISNKIIQKERNFVPAGQSTQLIIGATPDTDLKIISLTENLYNKFKLKRVYYSAYVPINVDSNLPSLDIKPPLVRENRLYQADWLLRFYGFKANELLNDKIPNFNIKLDPKCDWAIRNLEKFPIEINKADYFNLLRVPGIGVISAKRIITARRNNLLTFENIKTLGVVLKRARYFITCNGKYCDSLKIFSKEYISNTLMLQEKNIGSIYEQLSFFNDNPQTLLPNWEDRIKCISGQI